ncbi:MAG TPA: iron-containing alcohol dehydrogenase [Acidimicrobiales bacterium]|nr:iron-containing alcohol dehydrogenase [Acidimicrobiales bacterium]
MTATWIHTGYAQRLHFGAGALDSLPSVLRDLGARRTMLISTEGRLASPDGERLVSRLGRVLESTFGGVRSHVPASVAQAAVLQARRDGVDSVVSFGGGSCMDLGKAVTYFVERAAGTPGASYMDRPALLHVAVPTTYSGAELTPYFGITDDHTRAKSGGGGPTTAPIAVVYDPVLTLSTPAQVSAETAMNALGHCVEAVYASRRSPEAEAIALSGVERIARWLPAVVEEPEDIEPRAGLLEGAALAGRALQNASMGVHHGLSQLLGGRTGMPHGLANALILPHAMRYNADVAPDGLARIGAVLGDGGDPPAAVARLAASVGLPARISQLGVDEAELDAVARLSQSNVAVRANPRPVSEEDARAILAAAW